MLADRINHCDAEQRTSYDGSEGHLLITEHAIQILLLKPSLQVGHQAETRQHVCSRSAETVSQHLRSLSLSPFRLLLPWKKRLMLAESLGDVLAFLREE
jgi:3-methyladenine DNA glycosylase AlkC